MKCLLLLILMFCGDSSLVFAAQHAPTIHIVKKGETLYGISKKYGTTEQELINLNPFLKTHQLSIGEKLQLPSKNEANSDLTDPSKKEKVNPVTMSKVSTMNSERKATGSS